MKVYEALAKAFAEEGTTAVFGMMGDANLYWLNALSKFGVNQYDVRHEGAGLAMADGMARITGGVGVATTTSGPGMSQLGTPMVCAVRAHTPMVIFCGDSPKGEPDYVQYLNQSRHAEAMEAGFVDVAAPQLAYEAVQRAFYLARTESRPIVLNAAMDIQQAAFDDEEDYVPSTQLVRPWKGTPNPVEIEEAADLIAAAAHPVVIVGRGARISGAGPEVLKLAERTGSLLATTLLAKNWLASAEFHVGVSGLYGTKQAMEFFSEADLVISVGASLNKYTTEHGYLYPQAKFVQIVSDANIVMGSGSQSDCYVQADAKLALEALGAALDKRGVNGKVGFRTPEVQAKINSSFDDPMEYTIEDGLVDPREACRVLDDMLPASHGLILGGGQQVCISTMLFVKERENTIANQFFGSIGQGLTTAIGACVANGSKPSFFVEGEASYLMHLADFDTAVRYDIPVLGIILNDEALGAEYHKSVSKGLNLELARIPSPNLGAVAVALGGKGAIIRSIDDLKKATAEYVADPKPTIFDVRISRNVVSIPYRRRWFGDEDA